MSTDGLYEENAWTGNVPSIATAYTPSMEISNFLSKSSFHNEEDGRLLACPSGASVEKQSFVASMDGGKGR